MNQTPAASPSRYHAVAMILHWLIAVMLIGNIGLAWYFNTLHGPAEFPPIQLHKSIGLTILLLSLARLIWRGVSPPPALPAGLTAWERLAARATHGLFYVVMIGMPLSGWAMVSAGKFIRTHPLSLFGLVPWPAIGPLTTLAPAAQHQAGELFGDAHGLLAKLAYVLIVLHVGAALWHGVVRRDQVLGRMIPLPAGRAA